MVLSKAALGFMGLAHL